MINRDEAKAIISQSGSNGWLKLIDLLYDNIPEQLTITSVFQKYGGLKIEFKGEDENFSKFIHSIYYDSKEICEHCGEKAEETIVDGLVTTLCKVHFDKIDAKQKYGFGKILGYKYPISKALYIYAIIAFFFIILMSITILLK